MTNQQWHTIESIIREALEMEPRSRAAFLEDRLTKDRELLAYAHRILRLVERPGENEELPDEVAGWRILLPLGEDRLCMDYLAERADGNMDQLMMFKVAKVQLDDAVRRQDLIQEMSTLTMMYNANIVRVHDTGWVREGRPFIVYEFEGGLPITEMSPKLDLKENLTTFLRILTAVGYAHQRNIFHGDLRPSNVLLKRDRVPRLVDAGLARAFAKVDDATATQQEIDAESIAYFSPEQVRGWELNESSDIYALGVILYEMLAGKPPYGQPKDSVVERGRAICEAIPPRVEGVDDDVNYILTKALQKDPEERYPSAVLFSKDIEQYLEGRSVMPRQEPLLELVLRSVKQNWITVALVMGVLGVALFAFSQRGKSENKAAQIQKIKDALLAGGEGAAQAVAAQGMSGVQSAKKHLDDMLEKNADKPQVVGELAKSYLRLAEVDLKGSGLLAGDRGAAIESARKAYELTMQLLNWEGATDLELLDYARSAKILANLLSEARDYQEAVKVAQDWKNKLSAAASANPELQKALAAADAVLADLMFASGDQQASMPLARSAVRQFGAIFEADRGNTSKARDYVQSANNAGGKALQQNMLSEALAMFLTAETTIRPQATKPDSEVGPILDLSKTLSGLGETLAKSKQDHQARARFKEARQLLEQAQAKEKDGEESAEGLADILLKSARLSRESGDVNVAHRDVEKSIELLRKLLNKPGSRSDYRRQLAVALTLRGEIARQQRNPDLARESFTEALSLWNSYGRMAGLRPEEEREIDRLKRLLGR